jgi:hypothetical protein
LFSPFSFLFCKIREQESRTDPAQRGSLALVGGIGGRERGVNMVQKVCTHVCKCKNDTCCNYSMHQWVGEGMKGSSGGGEFKYDIVDTL